VKNVREFLNEVIETRGSFVRFGGLGFMEKQPMVFGEE